MTEHLFLRDTDVAEIETNISTLQTDLNTAEGEIDTLQADVAALQAVDPETDEWTPVLTFATPGDLSVVYSTQEGRYIKIGPQVTLFFSITTSTFTHGSASGAAIISGLPFTIANEAASGGSRGAIEWQGVTKANYTSIVANPVANTTTLRFRASGSAQNASALQAADMPSGGNVILNGSITYYTTD